MVHLVLMGLMVVEELTGYLGQVELGVSLELKDTQEVMVILATKDAKVNKVKGFRVVEIMLSQIQFAFNLIK